MWGGVTLSDDDDEDDTEEEDMATEDRELVPVPREREGERDTRGVY